MKKNPKRRKNYRCYHGRFPPPCGSETYVLGKSISSTIRSLADVFSMNTWVKITLYDHEALLHVLSRNFFKVSSYNVSSLHGFLSFARNYIRVSRCEAFFLTGILMIQLYLDWNKFVLVCHIHTTRVVGKTST